MSEPSETDAAISAGQQLAGYVKINDHLGLRHAGMVTVDVDPVPHTHESKVKLDSLVSFNAYVQEYAIRERAHIFLKNSDAAFALEAILTHWGMEGTETSPVDARKPMWTAIYSAERSRQLTKWCANNGQSLSQAAFADFLDANAKDIDDPPAADVLEMISTFELRREVNFKSVVRLRDGTFNVGYDEQDKVHEKGELTFPGTIQLHIPLFKHGEKCLLQLALRYKLKDGVLSIQYRINDLDEAIEQHIDNIASQVGSVTGLPIYRGSR